MNEEIEHTPFVTTEPKKNNLIKLANYLMALPDDYENFEMSKFCAPSITYSPHHYDPQTSVKEVKCGAVACAVGHAPSAGIGKYSRLNDWDEFSTKFLIATGSEDWEWCFSGAWADTDNTPKGAALRINYLLEKGLPNNIYEQMNGWSDLSYKVGEV